MPYLKDDFKTEIEKTCNLKGLTDYFASMEIQNFAGAVNFLIFTIVKRYLKRNGTRYWMLALILGTLVCSIFEIYRRVAGPYEDEAIQKNGDVE